MAAVDLVIGQGLTVPTYTDTILDSSGAAFDLTNATVKFVMRSLANSSATVNAAATIVSATTGQVSYTFSATDTATAGLYMGQWIVTEQSGATYAFPNVGYRSIEVQASLASAPQTIVSVADAKDILNFPADEDAHDTKILRWIKSAQVTIEQRTGPIVPKTIEEWHDGGHYRISLRYRPSRAWGTNPMLIVNAVSEYNGPIEWPLAMVGSLDEAVLYSVQVEPQRGFITRTTAGGGVQSFPNMPQSVHVWYTTGQWSIPDNIYEAALEYLREMYQQTAQALRGVNKGRSKMDDLPPPIVGFALSGRVREIIGDTRRAPSVA